MNSRMLDLDSYPRKAHFEYFLSLPNPWAGVTVNVDVTAMAAFCRARGCSFYTAFIHAAALAANGVPELRRRLRDGGIVEYDHCDTSHVEALDDGTYGYCTLHHGMDWDAYLSYAGEARARCRKQGSIEEDAEVDSLLFITCLPWLHYTQLVQPTGTAESNPRISWGKYEADFRGRLMMPVTLLAHHGLADGAQFAQFYDNLNRELSRLPGGKDT